MQIGICDDERTARTESRQICQKVLQLFGEKPEIIEFSNGRDVLSYPEELDILLLDIELSGMSGLEVKQHLEYQDISTLIIFLTNHSKNFKRRCVMIELQKVNKKFGEHVLFEDFDLTIKDGEFVVFAGESGCGKTTLLNMIGGVEPLDSGEILVDGHNLKNKKYLKDYYMYKVGFLFQNFALIEGKSVKQNLELVQKKSRSNYTVDEVLEKVGLSGKEEHKVYKLSGGEQQRVALARLMYKQCDILLADEPTGSLDSRNAAQVMGILEDLHKDGKTIVLVTHNEKIIQNSERVVYL